MDILNFILAAFFFLHFSLQPWYLLSASAAHNFWFSRPSFTKPEDLPGSPWARPQSLRFLTISYSYPCWTPRLQISSLLDIHFTTTITQKAHERHALWHSGKRWFKTAVTTVVQCHALKIQSQQRFKFSVFGKTEKRKEGKSPYKRRAHCETRRSFFKSFESRDFSLSYWALKCGGSSPLPLSRWLHTP